MDFEKKYKKSLDKQWCLRFKTRHPDSDNYDGVILYIKDEFIVMREERDFEFDGLVILGKKFVKGYRDDKYERCCNEVLRGTGALKKSRAPRWLNNCETIPAILSEMMDRDIWPGIETVFAKKINKIKTAFYLGPITGITDDRFRIKCYDAAGKWEKNYWLKYSDVFKIELDSKYCNYFNAYMRRKQEKKDAS